MATMSAAVVAGSGRIVLDEKRIPAWVRSMRLSGLPRPPSAALVFTFSKANIRSPRD